MTRDDVFRQWAQKAEGDLSAANLLFAAKQAKLYDQVCFHCQQGAEKHLKALLSYRGVSFSKTHDLRELAGLLPPGDVAKFDSTDLDTLSAYAVNTRYPGLSPMSGSAEAKRAIAAAKRVKTATLALK